MALAIFAPLRAEPRIALIITNEAYTQEGAKLTNTHRDGDLVAAALTSAGFEVTVERDTATEGDLLSAIGRHVERLAHAGPDAVGFLYYSGHGAADRPDGANYLIPTQAPLTHVAQLPLMAVRLDKITGALASAAKINFVVFDACRNVPLQRSEKAVSFKGFAPVREQPGLLVAWATEPGNVAVDQSIYAKALAEEIVKPGLEASQAFRAVTRRVLAETSNRQQPEYLDKRLYDFSFVGAVSAAPPGNPLQTTMLEAPSEAKTQMRSKSEAFAVGSVFRDCPDCPEMVVVPAGSFMMGSPESEEGRESDEGPQRRVTIAQPFAAGKYEVTFAEWDACVSASGCKHNPGDAGWGRGKQPVINVAWDDAQEFAGWLSGKTGKSYRLLTEAEWEYAARAGTTMPFSTGTTITTGQANFNGSFISSTFKKKTSAVGSYNASAFGLYDMHGNVEEWVEDCYSKSFSRARVDGSKTPDWEHCWRVVRGGHWGSLPESLRSAERSGQEQHRRISMTGFRLARTLPPTP